MDRPRVPRSSKHPQPSVAPKCLGTLCTGRKVQPLPGTSNDVSGYRLRGMWVDVKNWGFRIEVAWGVVPSGCRVPVACLDDCRHCCHYHDDYRAWEIYVFGTTQVRFGKTTLCNASASSLQASANPESFDIMTTGSKFCNVTKRKPQNQSGKSEPLYSCAGPPVEPRDIRIRSGPWSLRLVLVL